MIAPKFPDNEKQRQAEVDRYQLLDTLPEESYDNITSIISYICHTPISLITLLDNDRNFLKSHHGIDFNESPREISFCGHAINAESIITIIEDAREDARFQGNPLVTDFKAVFYAGVPLVNPNGYKLGTLCVYDQKPRKLTKEQKDAMIKMSRQVIDLFEQHYQNLMLKKYQEDLQHHNKVLSSFAHHVSHDLKLPLTNIKSSVDLLLMDKENTFSDESRQYIDFLISSTKSLADYIDGLLHYYKMQNEDLYAKSPIDLKEIIEQNKKIFFSENNIDFEIECNIEQININPSAMLQILINLIGNGLKYNSKENKRMVLRCHEDDEFYHFSVADNGDGIPENKLEKIFELFVVLGKRDSYGHKNMGIGLAIVKELIEKLNGTIKVNSTLGEGSEFIFTIKK